MGPGTLYAGGDFSTIGGAPVRYNLAALDLATGLATSWNPVATWGVSALAVSGSTVYVGGGFQYIGDQSRNGIAAVDAATGTETAWNPNPGAHSSIYALLLDGSTVYVGGGFATIGGQPRTGVAVLDASAGMAVAWSPNANSSVLALARSGATLYAGGSFSRVGMLPQSGVAAIGEVPTTRVDTPVARGLALAFRRVPAVRELEAEIVLADGSPARLELFDLGGWLVAAHEVGPLGAGSHAVRLGGGHTLAPGVYLLRLSQGRRTLSARGILLRWYGTTPGSFHTVQRDGSAQRRRSDRRGEDTRANAVDRSRSFRPRRAAHFARR